MDYTEFASNISFFEFNESEFYKPHFEVEKYRQEIEILNRGINIDTLTKSLEGYPSLFDIIEELFQLKRFTNAQYIHFCFDIISLNTLDWENLKSHAENCILHFENGRPNKKFLEIFEKFSKRDDSNLIKFVLSIKRSIPVYIDHIIDKRDDLYTHLSNSIGARLRFANYVITRLGADQFVKILDLKAYLAFKRHPVDTKSIHGKFGGQKIEKALVDHGATCINDLVTSPSIPLSGISLPQTFASKVCFLREKAIEGIVKRKGRKLKRFDFILLWKGMPKIAVETNFYSTSGTKIGINEGEYTDLISDIEKLNQERNYNLQFMWITDGNYWLTDDGKTRFDNLKKNYFRNDYEMLNYNLFRRLYPQIVMAIT